MPIHPNHGARIYYDRDGEPALLAYRRLLTQYLVLFFCNGKAWHATTSFSEILDALPVESVPLGGVQLALQPTLDETMKAWRIELHQKLLARVPSWSQSDFPQTQAKQQHPCPASHTRAK